MSEETTAKTFIGNNEIATVADSARVTPMGSAMVDITFVGGGKMTLTKKTYELVVTDVASDMSIARRIKFNALVPAIKVVIGEYDIQVAEIQPLLQELAASIDNNFARATNFAWTKDDSEFIPNTNPLYARTLNEAHDIITSIPAPVQQEAPKENASGTDAQ